MAEIPKSKWNGQDIHAAFINGGIEKAVHNLSAICSKPSNVLGFSIGGAIAWRTALSTKMIEKIYAVSATRLRKEMHKPTCLINLEFGELDDFAPQHKWFNQMKITPVITIGAKHEMYLNPAHKFDIYDRIMQFF